MALSPDQRRRLLRMNMLMSYAAFASSKAVAWTPATLFANAEVGGWYDPSDLTTMFQDAAGTTAASLESPVGLVLDKSKGLALGSELIANAADREFTSDTGYWTKEVGITISGGSANWTNAAQDYGLIKSNTFSANTYYEVSFTISNRSAGGVKLFTNFGASTFTSAYTANGTYTVRFYYGGFYATTPFGFYASAAGTTLSIDSVSVKAIPGNHLSQSTSTARPVLSARVNLLTRTEEFDNAAWTKDNVTPTANDTTAPDGTNTADKILETATNTAHQVYGAGVNAVQLVNGVTYNWSVCVKDIGRRYFALWWSSYNAVLFDLTLGTVSGTASGGLGSPTGSIQSVGNGWFRCTYTCTAVRTGGDFVGMGTSNSGTAYGAFTGDVTKGIYIWGADLRPANAGVGLPAYQRVGAATSGSSSSAGTADYDSGPEWPRYLKFDGVDDMMSFTSPITGNAAFTAFVGAQRTGSQSGRRAFVQLGASATRGGVDAGYGAATGKYNFTIAGISDLNGNTANFPNPVVQAYNYNGSRAYVYRENGVQQATFSDTADLSLTSAGAIAQRAPSDISQCNIYSFILVGRNLTAGEIASTETWVNGKVKAYA